MSDLGGGLDQKPATQCPRALPVFDGCAGGQRGRVARGRIPWWCCTSVDGRRATFMAEVVLPSAARGAGRRAKRTVGGLLSMPLSPDRRSHLLRRECRDRQRKSCGVGAVQKRCLPRLPAALPPAPSDSIHAFSACFVVEPQRLSSLHWTADRGQLASVGTARLVWWNLPLQPGIGHHPFAGLFGGAVDGLSPDPSPTCWKGYEAGRMDQGSWPVGSRGKLPCRARPAVSP